MFLRLELYRKPSIKLIRNEKTIAVSSCSCDVGEHRKCSSYPPPVKYQGELDFGYSLSVGLFIDDRIYLHTVQGAKIGDYFSAGVGIGFDVSLDEYYYMPLYLNLAGYLPTSAKTSFIASLDFGTAIDLYDRASWLYVTPAFGIKTGKFKIQLGYNVIKLPRIYKDLGLVNEGLSMNAIQLKMGIVF